MAAFFNLVIERPSYIAHCVSLFACLSVTVCAVLGHLAVTTHFHRASSYASAALAVVILSVRPSVCPPVRPSHALWQSQTVQSDTLLRRAVKITK